MTIKTPRATAPGAGAPKKSAMTSQPAVHTQHDVLTPEAAARQYETVVLVLQGGGALGAYQCGVYEGLHDAGIRPDWFAGISIGAINAAILAGNAPERRIDRLHVYPVAFHEQRGSLTAEAVVPHEH